MINSNFFLDDASLVHDFEKYIFIFEIIPTHLSETQRLEWLKIKCDRFIKLTQARVKLCAYLLTIMAGTFVFYDFRFSNIIQCGRSLTNCIWIPLWKLFIKSKTTKTFSMKTPSLMTTYMKKYIWNLLSMFWPVYSFGPNKQGSTLLLIRTHYVLYLHYTITNVLRIPISLKLDTFRLINLCFSNWDKIFNLYVLQVFNLLSW